MNNFLDFFHLLDSKGKTFRPKKRFSHGTTRYSLHKYAQASLQSGINLKEVVRLPQGEDMNDWVAVHVVDFFNRINLIYGTVSEYCTSTSCPKMSGGSRYEYFWQDSNFEKFKKPTPLPAHEYIENLIDWVEGQINNEAIFPTTSNIPFPKTFIALSKKILTRLFRVFVHVYIHHFDRIVSIGAEPHINTCFKHFYYFVNQFDLISAKEMEPLAELVTQICKE